ncbi:hypothetical protein G7062_00020 [Erysipelothrix sp. HDW6C]|uniref:hypothetical protein n=1 Tax=Erysipelothrix sp. HDW6C TaxID=2714930 RepID=UPI00140E32A7|nr:hypothetical protein [Erysipelothrix sp. HDW6C]QIK68761.1 hypothetical protein G7062_00020 [Erysipelothrix sp. HDW6C]
MKLYQFIKLMYDKSYKVTLINVDSRPIGNTHDHPGILKHYQNAKVLYHAPTDLNEYAVQIEVKGTY